MLTALLFSLAALAAPSQIPYDTMIVQAVTPAFFEKSDWNSHWSQGDLIVLGKSYVDVQPNPYVRPAYDPLLQVLIERQERKAGGKGSAKEKGDARKALNLLKQIKADGLEGPLDSGGSIVPPKEMLLDRDTVAFVPNKDLASLGQKVLSLAEKTGTVRFAGELAPICYSPNLRYAIARLKSAREHCTVYFVVEKREPRMIHVDVVWDAPKGSPFRLPR